MCGISVISVHEIVEAKRSANFLKKLTLVYFLGTVNLQCAGKAVSSWYSVKSLFVSFPIQSSDEPIVTADNCRRHCMNETEFCSAIVFDSQKQQCFYFTESASRDYQVYTVDNDTQVAYMRVCSSGDIQGRIQSGFGVILIQYLICIRYFLLNLINSG